MRFHQLIGRFHIALVFSACYWEVPSFITSFLYAPLVFNNLLGGSTAPFIFHKSLGGKLHLKISWCGVILKEHGGVGVISAGATVVRRAFIALLAYTNWLDLSRDKVSFCQLVDDHLKHRPGVADTPRLESALTAAGRWRRLSVDAVQCRLLEIGLPKIQARAGWNHADLL